MASGMEAFSLLAKLVLDTNEYYKGMNGALSTASKIGSGIGNALKTTAKIATAGIVATTTAVAGLVKSSVSAYADYEQLVGGVETLFGTGGQNLVEYANSVGKTTGEVKEEYFKLLDAQEQVLKNADNAYKTAGLSANEYMETVTGMAAALNQSLGGNTMEAAKKADLAITDMADNANKMGTSMEAIQNAYSGFAKANYTMLDNLKLDYGGTKEEMARLLADAEKLSGQKFDLSSYADIVDAIHVVQTEMGITGTTAKEATETISGSLAMTKSAWQNLVTGLTNPDADISVLISNLVESSKAALSNLVPAISQSLTGIVQLVQGIAPVIADELPTLIENTLPMLLDAGVTLFQGLVNALPTLMNVLFDQIPMLLQSIIDAVLVLLPMFIELGGEFLLALAQGLAESLPQILPKVLEVINKIVDMFSDPTGLMEFVNAAIQIILTLSQGLIQALPVLIPAIAEVILNLVMALTQPDNLMMILEAAVMLALAIAEGLIKAIPDLLKALILLVANLLNYLMQAREYFKENAIELIQKMIEGIKSKYSEMKQKAKELIQKMIDGIKDMFSKIKDKGKELVDKAKDGFMQKVEDAKNWGRDLIQNFINGILDKWNALKDTVSNVANTVKDFLGFSEPKYGPLSNFHTFAPDMMELFMQGIEDNKSKLIDTVTDAFNFDNVIQPPSYEYQITGRNNTDAVLQQILAILPQLANQSIVLDTGILVGQTAPQMNEALGTIYSREKRSV